MAYLDRISFTPVLEEAVREMAGLITRTGLNPSSPTRMGSQSKKALETARESTASLIAADPRDLVFVSTGTESVNLAIRGLVRSAIRSRKQRKILISAIEHVSVVNTARALEKEGFEVQIVPVDTQGKISMNKFREALESDVLLASIQMANPEVGTIQDIETLATLARSRDVLFHTDAVDAAGWIPIDVNKLNVDALSFSGTQFGGPPGAAVLYVKKGVSIVPMLFGGIQERHRRPGLENIPAIAGLGIASDYARTTMTERATRVNLLANRLRTALLGIDDVLLTGHTTDRIPGHVSALIRCVEGEALLLMLDMKNVQAASGSSCTAKDLKISPILTALGIEHADAQGSLVFSLCDNTNDDDIEQVANVLPPIVSRLREMSPLWRRR